VPFGDNVEKKILYIRTYEKTTLAHCILDTEVFQHTLRLRNTASPLQQWLPERSPVLRLYVHGLYCYKPCVLIQGESLARGPNLLSIINYVIEIMT